MHKPLARIGIYLGHLDSLLYARILPLFRVQALARNLQLFVVDGYAAPEYFDGQPMDGIIEWYDPGIDRGIQPAANLPQVAVSHQKSGIPALVVENADGMRAMLRHLVQVHGCRFPAYLGGPVYQSDARQRQEAFVDESIRLGLAVPAALVVAGQFTPEDGERQALAVLDSGWPVDALVAASDSIAIGAMKACHQRGLEIPRDIRVTGFDDVAEAAIVEPSLSTVVQPLASLVAGALDAVLAMIAGKAVPAVSRLPVHLRIRNSCGCSCLPEGLAALTDMAEDPRLDSEALAWLEEHGSALRDQCTALTSQAMADGWAEHVLKLTEDLLATCPLNLLDFFTWSVWLSRIEGELHVGKALPELVAGFQSAKFRVGEAFLDAAFHRRQGFLKKMKHADELYRVVSLTPSLNTVTQDFFLYCRTLELSSAALQLFRGKTALSFLQFGVEARSLKSGKTTICQVFSDWILEPGIFIVQQLVAGEAEKPLGQLLLSYDDGYPVQYIGIARQLGKILLAYQVFQEKRRTALRLKQRQGKLEELQQRLLVTIKDVQETQNDLIEVARNDAHSHLVAGLAHELNTPFGVALTAISYIHSHTAELASAVASERLTRSQFSGFIANLRVADTMLTSNLERTRKLLADIQSLQVNEADYERREIDLVEFLALETQRLEGVVRSYGHRIQFGGEGHLPIVTSPGAFSQVINCLVSNSLDHAFAGAINAGLIQIGLAYQGSAAVVTIADNGKGMPDRIAKRIFEPFAAELDGSGKVGLGLHLVYTLVNGPLGAEIRFAPASAGGSCFTITLRY